MRSGKGWLRILLLVGGVSSGRGGCPLGWPLRMLAPSREGVVPLCRRDLPLELFQRMCGQHASLRGGREGGESELTSCCWQIANTPRGTSAPQRRDWRLVRCVKRKKRQTFSRCAGGGGSVSPSSPTCARVCGHSGTDGVAPCFDSRVELRASKRVSVLWLARSETADRC